MRREPLGVAGGEGGCTFDEGAAMISVGSSEEERATVVASTATAHLWIEQPMSGLGDDGKLRGAHGWFNTHPPLEERIALLREL